MPDCAARTTSVAIGVAALLSVTVLLAGWPRPATAQTGVSCTGKDWAVLGDRHDWAAVELVGWVTGTDCLLNSGDRATATLPPAAVEAFDGQRILVVGGRKAVPDSKVHVLAAAGACRRFAGKDRLETMRAVVQFADDGGTDTLTDCGGPTGSNGDPPQAEEDRSDVPVHDRDAEMRLRVHAVADWFSARGASAQINWSVESGSCGLFSFFVAACVKQSDPTVIVYNWGDDADGISQSTLAHEYAHVWQFHHQPALVESDPLWIVEGFADLFGHWYGGEPGAECPLDDVRFNDVRSVEGKHEDNLHYTLGECAVRYLDDTRGRTALLDYFRSDGAWDERFYTSFGVSPQAFYTEWADRRYRLLLSDLAQARQQLIGANSAPNGADTDCEGICVHDHYPSADGRHYIVELRGVPADENYCRVDLTLNSRRTGDWSNELHRDGHDGRFVIDVRVDHEFDGFEWECS